MAVMRLLFKNVPSSVRWSCSMDVHYIGTIGSKWSFKILGKNYSPEKDSASIMFMPFRAE